MTAPLVQQLSLVVDAVTGNTETRMDALATASREAGDAATRSAGQVAAAAERVAAAQMKRDDAADRVALAERRLQEVQERYAAGSSQVLAAEQRLEASRRQLHVATSQVEAAQEAETRATRESAEAHARAATETDRTSAGMGRFQGQLDSVKAAAAGLVGFQVGDWLRDQADAYLSGARGAATLAASMNATIAEGGRLSQLFSTLGLDAADLLEIQAEFATKIGENGRNLESFGASLHLNAGGTVNWANTLVDALTQLQKIPDATERNRLGFQLFGEEGYKQLSRLLTSGMSVEEALAAIGTPFTEEDVQATQDFDREMLRLSLSAGDLGRTLAREVVPVAAGLVNGVGELVGIVSEVPLPIGLATAAAVIMAQAGLDPAAAAGVRLSAAATLVRTEVTLAGGAMLTGSVGAAALSAGFGVASAAASRLWAFVGGPLGAGLIAAGTAFHFASQGSDDLAASAHDAAMEMERTKDQARGASGSLGTVANNLEEHAGYWERSAAYVRGYEEDLGGFGQSMTWLTGPFQRLTMGFGDTEDTARGFELAIEDAREQLGEFGAQQELTQQTARGLNDLIAQGTTGGAEFAGAVRDAALAQAEETRTSDTAAAAIAAYNASTTGAVEATLSFINARYASEDANFAFLQAMDDAKEATDDSTTSVDEARQAQVKLIEAALGAAEASADAAVENATASGTVMTAATEAATRADSMLADLRGKLNQPDLTKGAREELQGIVDRLQEAKDKGDIETVLKLTGAEEATGELDEATKDREATVRVESRNGPAVDTYLDGLAEARDAYIRTESRGGPAVDAYLDSLATDRLALIHVESRNGPAVDNYLDGLARERLAIIRVETRGGPAVDAYLDELAGARRTAVIDVQRRGGAAAPAGGAVGAALAGGRYGAGGSVVVEQMTVQVQAESGGRLSQQSLAEAGRQYVAAIGAYERRNGPGWRGTR